MQDHPENMSSPNPVPPKPEVEEKKSNVWVKSLTSLLLYLALGYFLLSHNVTILLILTAVVIFHELGHFFAMKYFGYTELGIFFIPLLGAYASGTKREVSQTQSSIILLAGPLPGILLGFALYFLNSYYLHDHLLDITAKLLVFLNLLNLLPIYPLDGGQLLNRLFLDEYKMISKIFIIISASALAWVAWRSGWYVLLIFPLMMLLRLRSDTEYDVITKKVEDEGVNLDTTYEDMPDEDYWKMRNILIRENHASLGKVPPVPPFTYANDEDKVVEAVKGLLQRSIIQDLSIAGKLLILVIWITCFLAPWLIEISLPFMQR